MSIKMMQASCGSRFLQWPVARRNHLNIGVICKEEESWREFQQNVKRRIIVTIAGLILVGTAVIVLTTRHEPPPLSDDETLRIQTAIHAIAPGDIRNLIQNQDGSVTAFVTSGHYSKQTVVATKVGDEWNASVTMVYF